MRILMIHNYYQIRGGEDVVFDLERKMLEDAGHEIIIYSCHNNSISGLASKIFASISCIFSINHYINLRKLIRLKRPDIIHVHNFFPLISPSVFYACRAERVPCVLTLHNFRILCPTALLRSGPDWGERSLTGSSLWTVRKRAYRDSFWGSLLVSLMVDIHKCIGTWTRTGIKFVVLTEFAKKKFIAGGLREQDIFVRGTAVPPPSPTYVSGERSGFVFIGRLSEEKGISTLLDAWKDLNVPLKIIGDGPLSDIVRSASSDYVEYLGRLEREEVFRCLIESQYIIIPSNSTEMLPVAMIEALSCGTPVIIANISGHGEFVERNGVGYSFEVGNHSQLAEIVRSCINDTRREAELGRAAVQLYDEQFSVSSGLARLEQIYGTAMESLAAQGYPPNRLKA